MSGFRIEIDRQTVTLPNGRSVELDVIRHPGASALGELYGEALAN